MTEEEWFGEAARPDRLADHLSKGGAARTKAGRRKLRLFACGASRAGWGLLPDPALREAVRTAERFADGLASAADLAAARAAVAPLASDSGPYGGHPAGVRVAVDLAVATTHPRAYSAAFVATVASVPVAFRMPAGGAAAYLCRLARCAFGNPLPPGHR